MTLLGEPTEQNSTLRRIADGGADTLPTPGTGAEIPHLTDAWQKARKNYTLIAGVLIAWELVGLELTRDPIDNINVSLQAPQAAPFVFLALLAYFAFRASVEWFQCDLRRRQMLASRLDWFGGHALAILAGAIYVTQRLSEIQIGALLTSVHASRFLFGLPGVAILSAMLGATRNVGQWRDLWRSTDGDGRTGLVMIPLLSVLFPVAALIDSEEDRGLLGVLMLATAAISYWLSWWKLRSRKPPGGHPAPPGHGASGGSARDAFPAARGTRPAEPL